MDRDWYDWSMEIAHYIPLKFHLQSSWKHGEPWPWMTSSLRCILQSKGVFLPALVEHFTVQGDESPGDCLRPLPAPAYSVMQKPVSSQEGLLECFIMGFQFSLLPKSRIPPNSSLVKPKPRYEQGTVSLGNLMLEKSILTSRPGKERPVLSCSAHDFTKYHLKFFTTSRALCEHQLILVRPCCEILK